MSSSIEARSENEYRCMTCGERLGAEEGLRRDRVQMTRQERLIDGRMRTEGGERLNDDKKE